MQHTNLYIFGSETFYKIIFDLNIFNKVYLGKDLTFVNNSIIIVFIDSLPPKFLRSFLKLNFPIILISSGEKKKTNKFNLNNFSIFLKTPIVIQNFIEISKILISKFNYLKTSNIFVKKYILNSNNRFIERDNKRLKLTEIEVKLILLINNSNGFTKEKILENIWNQKTQLDTHAFETCLHRLRKKIKDEFDDDHFIHLKNGKYYLL